MKNFLKTGQYLVNLQQAWILCLPSYATQYRLKPSAMWLLTVNKFKWFEAQLWVASCSTLYQLTNQFIYSYFCLSHLPSVLWCCWLGGRRDIRLVKNWVVGYWHGYLSGTRCRLAYDPADAAAMHSLSCASNPDWFYLSGTSSPAYSWKKSC